MDKSSKPIKMLLLMISLMILLIGSFAAFHYGYYLPNQPASVVKRAVNKLSKQSGARNFESNSASYYDNEKVQDLTIKSSINDQGDIRADITQILAKNTLTNSLIFKSKQKELYIKINQSETFLASYGITNKASTQSVANQLNNNWLKIDSSSFAKSNVTPGSNYDNMKLCTESFINFVSYNANSDHNFAHNIAKFQNSYQKAALENVASSKTTVFKSKYDDDVATKANQEVYQEYRSRIDAINSDCSETINSTLITDSSNIKTDSTRLYINSSGDILKADSSVTQGKAKNTGKTIFISDILDASVPSNVITVGALTTNSQDYVWLVSVLKAFVKMYIN